MILIFDVRKLSNEGKEFHYKKKLKQKKLLLHTRLAKGRKSLTCKHKKIANPREKLAVPPYILFVNYWPFLPSYSYFD